MTKSLRKLDFIISNTEKNHTILNQLIEDGFYYGEISKRRFTLTRTTLSSKLFAGRRIIGELNDNNQFLVTVKNDYSFIKIKGKYLLSLMIVVWLIITILGGLVESVLFLFVLTCGFLAYLLHKLSEEKELEIFTNRFLNRKKKQLSKQS